MASIVIIGAGSAVFGPSTVASILRSEHLRGSRLGLVDIDGESLDHVCAVARRMNEAWGAEMEIGASLAREELLEGAEFVVVSIEVPPREALWRMDWQIPLQFGLRQPYGENGGPGGLMHTFRQATPMLQIARDMERLCPGAWLINFSNPLPRLTRMVTKYSQIKSVGKCHQINVGYGIVAVLLREEYGIQVAEGTTLHSSPENTSAIRRLAASGRQHFSITAAGLNHFTWMVDVRDRKTGEDLYPLLREKAAGAPAGFEPLSMELFKAFGYCPVPGDNHLAEYLPWTHDPLAEPWETYELPLYDWESNESLRASSHDRLKQMATGNLPVDGLRESHSEGAVELIEAIDANLHRYEEAVNVPNQGAIPNLPAQTIVELPAVASSMGVRPVQMEPLPAAIAELCRREAALVELAVDAAVSGDRGKALQALLLDPMINDIGRARQILDAYLDSFAEELPQFDR